MRAITQRTTGGPEVLEVTEVPDPRPGPGEVLVRVQASGVNPIDAKVRSGEAEILGEPPFILGWDVSGVVEELGDGVSALSVGDAVFGMTAFPQKAGAYAELVVAPAEVFIGKPEQVGHVHAAALPLAALTAWQGLVTRAAIGPGQRVLVHAGGGGVGHLAIQIAKARGAHVTTTASADKADLVRRLGADAVIDHRTTDFWTVVADLDVVLVVHGGEIAERSIGVLREGGVFVTTVGRDDPGLEGRVTSAGKRYEAVGVGTDRAALEALTDLVREGKLAAHVETVLPLSEAARAHELLDSGHTTGKIVLTVD